MRTKSRIFLLLMLAAPSVVAAQDGVVREMLPREIVVDADAWSWAAPDTVRVTVQLSASADTATAAAAKIEATQKAVLEAWNKLALSDLRSETRGRSISGAGSPQSAVSGAAQVKVDTLLAAETKSISAAEKIVDAALAAGATTVVDVDFSVQDGEAALDKASAQAAARAKRKAEQVAKSMGVGLGRLIAVTQTEETAEKVLRLKRQRGEDTDELSDRDVHVYINARYELSSVN